MKRLKLLSTSILIVSALLLSGVKNGSAQPLRPGQSLPQQRNETAQETKRDAPQIPASTNSPDSKASSDKSGHNSNQDTCGLRNIRKWFAGISAEGFFNFIIAVATGFIAWFNWQLVGVTDEMKTATKATADVAELALHSDRPYGIVQIVEFGKEPNRHARVILDNFGNGPLDIVEFNATRDFFDGPRFMPKCEYWEVNTDTRTTGVVIPPKGRHTQEVPFHLTLEERDVFWRGDKTLGVYGRILYRGGPPNIIYETCFFWWYLPDRKCR